jgi:voltage-gated potassium channel
MSNRHENAFDRFSAAVDGPMTVLTILWLPVLVIPLVKALHGTVDTTVNVIDYSIWALFAVEYLAKLWLTPQRGHFFTHHLLDLVIVVVPVLRPLRLLRLLRVIQVSRVAAVLAESLHRARKVFTHKGFHFVLLAAGLIVVACAGLVTVAERGAHGSNIHNFGQGLWWAMVTVTTVGYGDRYPITPMGQGVAVVLMLVGIGLIGVLTATVASFFVEQKTDAVEDRLERIEALLESLLVGEADPGSIPNASTPGEESGRHYADSHLQP